MSLAQMDLSKTQGEFPTLCGNAGQGPEPGAGFVVVGLGAGFQGKVPRTIPSPSPKQMVSFSAPCCLKLEGKVMWAILWLPQLMLCRVTPEAYGLLDQGGNASCSRPRLLPC